MQTAQPASPLLLDLGDLPEYPSNQVLRSVLIALGARLIDETSDQDRRIPAGATVVVPYPAHRRILRHALNTIGRRVTIIAVPMVLLHDSRVVDRREVSPRHPRALAYRLADRLLGRCSALVVSDTEQHGNWIAKRIGARTAAARLGSAVELLRPDLRASPPVTFDGTLRIVHYGNFFPLQGVETMLDALRELGQRYQLTLIGNAPADLDAPSNVTVVPPLAPPVLYEHIASAHVLLGQFGATPQRDLVVPTKIYDALAIGRPVITASGAALEQYGGLDALELVPPADADALAEALRSLMQIATDGGLPGLGGHAAAAYDAQLSIARSREDWEGILGHTR